MFFEGERVVTAREMILSETEAGRTREHSPLLPIQRQTFAKLFGIITGLPVTMQLRPNRKRRAKG